MWNCRKKDKGNNSWLIEQHMENTNRKTFKSYTFLQLRFNEACGKRNLDLTG